jgi:hypothetical protein
VPIPPFVKVAIDAVTAAAGLSEGPLFRRRTGQTPVLSRRQYWWGLRSWLLQESCLAADGSAAANVRAAVMAVLGVRLP